MAKPLVVRSWVSDLWMALIDLVVSDVIVLVIVVLCLARHPHLGLHIFQQILGRALEVAVPTVNSALANCSCHLQANPWQT